MKEIDTPSTFAERLIYARKAAGYSQAQVAEHVGMSQAAYSKLERGQSMSSRKTAELANFLNVHSKWLADGDRRFFNEVDSNVEVAPPIKKGCPEINWIQAGQWTEIGNTAIDLSEANYYPCPVNCSDQTFVLRVVGESMIPDYHEGELIFVDPERSADSGDDVVAVLTHQNKATFKRLVIEPDGTQLLKALNPTYPNRYVPIDDSCEIIGKVIFSGKIR
ncbi:LexA family protein [Oceanospirillum beijerinckii]|uniref:LexA family protein n=1 Tax=Oceanospirillum beijerinckii TaxID=64976 RepID=UPI0003F9D7BF|nr:XRE family transcriptional regulator [Oceanospirillum beijerinckii]